MRAWILVASLVMLGGCNFGGAEEGRQAEQGRQAAAATASDPLAAQDDAAAGTLGQDDIPDTEPRPIMQAQVVLDRLGFTPGVVDGKEGVSTRNALSGFQEANDLPVTGKLDDATRQALARWSNIPATRVVTIPAEFAQGPFEEVPEEPEQQAKLQRLGYESFDEKLAERFHTTVETLQMLNPGGRPAGAVAAADASPSPATSSAADEAATDSANRSLFRAGQQVRVPNVGADRIDAAAVDDQNWLQTLRNLGVGTDQPQAKRIVVSKSKGTMKVYDANDKLIGMFTATMGSRQDPLPLGEWKVLGVAHNPPFQYNAALFWDVEGDAKHTIPPGPNNPVGVVWIDLSKEHYGIHGTPAPETIGRAQSHGCVRLTNWDAARLAQMVSGGTQVLFEA